MFIIAYHNVPQNSKYRKHVNHIRYTCYKLKVQWIVNFGWLGWSYFLKTTIDKQGNWTPNPAAVSIQQLFSIQLFTSSFWPGTWEDGLEQQTAEIFWLNKTRWVEFLMFRSFWKLYFGVVINAALGKELEKPGPKMFGSEGSCWSVGFTFETCCAPEFGSEGNTECWDDVYTFESCCQSDGDPKKVGCNSSYFQRFRSLALDYYNSGWSKPALIELWPRILANYNARFLLCPPAALQAQLLQIEERGFLERPEKVIDKLLVF